MRIMRYKKIASLSLNIKYVMELNDDEFLYFDVPLALSMVKDLDTIFTDLLVRNDIQGPFTFIEDIMLMPEVG